MNKTFAISTALNTGIYIFLYNLRLRNRLAHLVGIMIFGSAWHCQQSYCRRAGVRRLFVISGFSEIAAWIQAKFCAQLPIHHIPRPFFLFFQNFQFLNVTFSLTWDPMGEKISKRYSSYNFHLIWAKFMINKVVMGNNKL